MRIAFSLFVYSFPFLSLPSTLPLLFPVHLALALYAFYLSSRFLPSHYLLVPSRQLLRPSLPKYTFYICRYTEPAFNAHNPFGWLQLESCTSPKADESISSQHLSRHVLTLRAILTETEPFRATILANTTSLLEVFFARDHQVWPGCRGS